MKRLKKKKTARVAIAALAVLLLMSVSIRTGRYRQVIYLNQRISECSDPVEAQRLTKKVERIVGRANYPYDHLPQRPIYPHFWEDYNDYKENHNNNY